MKEKIKTIIFWIILVILVLIGVYSYYYLIKPYSSLDISLPYRTYPFGIRNLDGKIIRDVYLDYDFQKEQGYFRFRTAGKGVIDNFRVDIPDQLNITNFKLFRGKKDITNNLSEEQFTIYSPGGISLRELNQSESEGIEILINFSAINNSFYPNGRFIFVADGVKEMTLNDDEVNAHHGTLLNFNFGNKYRCSEQCFIIEKLSNGSLNAFPNQNQFFISSGDNGNNIGGLTIFTISTFNFDKKEKTANKLNFGIATLSGVIVGLILFLLQVLREKKAKAHHLSKVQKSVLE